MVYTGRPSSGCENCRKAKKRCDEGLPACGRCARLGKACGGYRDLTQLMFRDQTATVTRRASALSDSSASASGSGTLTRQPTPEKEILARSFFFRHFVTANHLTFLEGVSPDEYLLKSITACGLAALANKGNDVAGREMARRHYIQAISATNSALQHPRKVREDNTLISVFLLGVFERLTWERGSAVETWKHHVRGSVQVLQLRGRDQVTTRTGAALFRDVRANIITNALWCEEELPDFLVRWTQALEYDPMHTPGDQLTVLAVRAAAIRSAFRTGSKTDLELATLASTLEQDLLGWSETTITTASMCSFHTTKDWGSSRTWNGTRHEYGIPQAHQYWNLWRSLRILLSRLQEAVWRRSWPTLTPSPPRPEHFKAIRHRMVADICAATAYALGNDNTVEPPRGSIASAYMIILPLYLAGTCLLEELVVAEFSPGGSRVILVDQSLHLDPVNQYSTQLAWLIQRVDYTADKIGLGWAAPIGKFLRGQCKIFYDLGRSRVVREQDVEAYLLSEMLDMGSISEDTEPDI